MKNYTILTLNKKNITDFAGARNNLLKNAKSDWVLFIDSDETASPELIKEIDEVTCKGSTLANGYYVYRKNYFLGRFVGIDKIIRLGRKNAGKWKRKVHEVWNIPARDQPLRGYLVHNTADNLRAYIEKINRYSDLHAKENCKESKKTNLFKIIFFPIGKFVETFIKSKNVVFSIIQSFHSFLAWSKEWEAQNA